MIGSNLIGGNERIDALLDQMLVELTDQQRLAVLLDQRIDVLLGIGEKFFGLVQFKLFVQSSLGSCKVGSQVNLERAMAADGRFGGHIVSGHIDGTGVIRSLTREENAIWVSIGTSPQILHLIVEKGSICIDGISLTVAKVEEEGFQVSVIPHTGEETTLLEKVPGDSVNLENDVIGKYVERLLGLGKSEEEKKESGITMEFLQEFGF